MLNSTKNILDFTFHSTFCFSFLLNVLPLKADEQYFTLNIELVLLVFNLDNPKIVFTHKSVALYLYIR